MPYGVGKLPPLRVTKSGVPGTLDAVVGGARAICGSASPISRCTFSQLTRVAAWSTTILRTLIELRSVADGGRFYPLGHEYC